MCLFCKAYNDKREIAARFLADGNRMDISAAIVERYFNQNGRYCGRSIDYIKDGNGAPLNYCPTCGKKLGDTA